MLASRAYTPEKRSFQRPSDVMGGMAMTANLSFSTAYSVLHVADLQSQKIVGHACLHPSACVYGTCVCICSASVFLFIYLSSNCGSGWYHHRT